MARRTRSGHSDKFSIEAADYMDSVDKKYLAVLREDDIWVLKNCAKNKTRYRKAGLVFECKLCVYHMDCEEDMEIHRRTEAHKRKKKIAAEDAEMKRISKPTENHEKALTSYLQKVYEEIRLSKDEMASRRQVIRDLEDKIHQETDFLTDVRLKVTGSVRSRLATKNSDTNIWIKAGEGTNWAVLFDEIYQVLRNNVDDYCHIEADYLTAKYPTIKFQTSKLSGVEFCLHLSDKRKHLTNAIFTAYSRWHTKLEQLAIIFTYWAKMENLCNTARGGLPSQCFPILAIYYGQQHGLVPVIVESEDIADGEVEDLQAKLDKSIEEFPRDQIHYRSLGSLWVEMLRFYSLDFNKEMDCVNILELEVVSKESRVSQFEKRLTIEEPSLSSRNLCLGASHAKILDFVMEQIRACYRYFAIPQKKSHSSSASRTRGQPHVARLRDYNFDFESQQFPRGKIPTFCRECHKEGHLAERCSSEMLRPCQPLPPLTTRHREILNKLLTRVRDRNQLKQQDIDVRQKILDELRDSIRPSYSDVILELYGSSSNGFGSNTSDMDICVTFYDDHSAADEENIEILETVEEALLENDKFDKVQVLDAKVPIVKFYSVEHKIEGDLSLYNCLAKQNTRLLQRYSNIDERVRTLGYCVKVLAKECKMADVFHHTLSSYAYILMTIFYLQRCDPPVLPVLQELYDGEQKPANLMIDGHNAWFFDEDNAVLAKKWPGLGKNKEDVAQLWIGFLEFYTHAFDIKTMVISIKQSADMRKLEKLWNSEKLAIQDPFNDNHNLGAGLSKRTNAYILNNLIVAREIFGTCINEQPHGYQSMFSYFFKDKRYAGTTPNDRADSRN